MKYILMGLLLSFSVFAKEDCYTDWKGYLICSEDAQIQCHDDWKGHTICE